jgi:hypothetical protein
MTGLNHSSENTATTQNKGELMNKDQTAGKINQAVGKATQAKSSGRQCQ